MRIVTLLFFSAAVVALTGCVTKGRYQREVSGLQSQIAQLNAELKAQQDKSQALEGQLQGSRARGAGAEGEREVLGGTYRTPSGFELPAADIQRALKGAGYYSGAIDGKIGPDSREAIRNFQRDNSLTADGVCGRQTWDKLRTFLDVLK